MTVSRAHAVVDSDEHGVRVSDAGSLNGTYVNGSRGRGGVARPTATSCRSAHFRCSSSAARRGWCSDDGTRLSDYRRGRAAPSGRLPRSVHLEGAVPRGGGARRPGAHRRRVPQVLAGGRRPRRDDSATAAGALPAARGHPREAGRFRPRSDSSRAPAQPRRHDRPASADDQGRGAAGARGGPERTRHPGVVPARTRRVRPRGDR